MKKEYYAPFTMNVKINAMSVICVSEQKKPGGGGKIKEAPVRRLYV